MTWNTRWRPSFCWPSILSLTKYYPQAPEQNSWNGQITGFYVGYSPVSGKDLQETLGETVQEYRKVIEIKDSQQLSLFEAHLTNLLRSTEYSVHVKAFNSKGNGPPSVPVVVKTMDDVPPTAPTLVLDSSTSSTITLSWSSSSGFHGQFVLYFKKLNSNAEWTEVPIQSQSMTHTVGNLECGTAYELFMTAHNSVGKSEPSSPLVVKTQGSPPTSPSNSQIFYKITSTEAVLNFALWKHEDCVVSDFTVRMRPKIPLSQDSHSKGDWILLTPRNYSNAAQTSSNLIISSTGTTGTFSSQDHLFFIRNLMPQTSFELEVTAKNSAGTSKAIYDLYTKSPGKTSCFSERGDIW